MPRVRRRWPGRRWRCPCCWRTGRLGCTGVSGRVSSAVCDRTGAAWSLRVNGARFLVDGTVVLETDRPPRGPLGFVAWVDNQWLVATPRGRFGWGLLNAEAQWLDLALVRIEQL